MNKIHLLILVALFFGSCDSQKSLIKNGQTYKNFRDFEPTDATEYNAKVNIVVNDAFVEKEIKLLNTDQVLSVLNNETVMVYIGQIDVEGKINYVPTTLSAKNSSYKVTIDYMKFVTLGQAEGAGKFLGYKRVGVGLRLIMQITTSKSGVNLGDISSIGIAAKAGQLKGTLMIQVIGIKSKEIAALPSLPSEINQSTVRNAMQDLAQVKSKIYDAETKLYPQVMAVKDATDNSVKNPNTLANTDSSPNFDATAKSAIDNKQAYNKIKLQFENNPATSLSKAAAANQ